MSDPCSRFRSLIPKVYPFYKRIPSDFLEAYWPPSHRLMSLSWYYLRRPPLELHFVDSGAFNGYKLNLNHEFYMNNTRIGELFPYAGM